MALAVLALASTASALDVPGDMDISVHYTMASDSLSVNGNITVDSGGWLDLTDIDIIMKCSEDGEFAIIVNNGGKLTMDGGSISAY